MDQPMESLPFPMTMPALNSLPLTVLRRSAREWISRRALKQPALFCLRSAGLIALCLAAPFLAAAGSWQLLSPSPTASHINSFVHGGGQFVGVGGSGEIITSPDGATWTSRESGIQDSLARVVYDGTRFIAISGTTLLTSSDGILWTKQTVPAILNDIAAGNNLLVAIAAPAGTGQPYRLMASPDGITWTSSDSAAQPMRILFTNGVFVAVDTSGDALSSTDGLTWTTTPLPDIGTTPYFAAGNGSFLVSLGTKTYLSNNGTTWREVTSHPVDPGSPITLVVPNLQGGVAGSTMGFAGGYFYIQQNRYAADPYRTYRSADGETWEAVSLPFNADLSTLASGGGVVVGTELTTFYVGPNPASYAIYSSSDGLIWTNRSTYATNTGTSLVYGLGRFFSSGQVSSDALTWVSTPFEPTHAAGDLVFRVSSKFTVTGNSSTIINANGVTSVAVSADGLTSLPVDVKMATPRSVAFGAGHYVFVGDSGNVSSSTDGLTWTAGTSGTTNDLQAVIFAFSRFVAIGSKGTLVTSPDGVTWTVQNTSTTIDFLSAAAGSDRIVVGTTGSAAAVPALTLSGNVTVQIAATRRSDALIWFDGEFTSVEQNPLNDYNGSISFARSTDGSTWTDIPLRYPRSLGGRSMITAGNGTALMALPAGSSWSLTELFTAVFQNRIAASNAPVITHAPVATTIHRGETATFGVGVTGSGAFSYQWNRNGTPITGATSQVLSLPLIQDSDAADYTVTVSNSLGSVTSASAKLTVQTPIPLTITKQPVGGTLYSYQPFDLTVEVSGSGPITYQWRRNGTPVYSTSPILEIYTASYSMDNYTGTYDVVITAPYSTVTSQAVIVSRSGPIVTVSQSGGTSPGSTLIVTATATSKSPFTYAWNQTVGGTLVGAADATLVLPNLTSNDTSPYRVTVTDADGISTDAYFTVAVFGSDPAPATAQVTAAAGQKLTLRAPISVSDIVRPSFQWRFKNSPIAGATAWSFTTPAMSDINAGDYSVVVTNSSGGTATYTTTITLGNAVTAPTVVAQTTSRAVSAGSTTTFSVSAGDASVSSYQWQISPNSGGTWANISDGGPYSGATTQTLAIAGATAAMNGYQYRCVVGNTVGNATSTAATLSINSDPMLVYPVAIARGSSGNLFVSDASANVIRMVTPAGAASIFAGTAGSAGSLDGIGSAARFNQPGGVAFDSAGNLYVADTGNATIRKITAAGVVTTLAGDPSARGNVDATGSAARFNHPVGLSVDATGNIYVADTFTHTVRKITSGGIVTTLAGTNAVSGSSDGSGAAARFSGPAGVAVDASGMVYVADTGNSTIRKITASGVVTTLAGLPGVGGSNDGTGGNALFSQPTSLVVDTNGTVYVADTGNDLIRKVTSAGVVTLLAGVPGIAGLSDGVGLDALLDQPHGMALDGNGNLYVADTGNAALRKIALNGTVTTLALTAAPPPAPVPSTPTPAPSTSGSGSTSAPSASGGGGAITPWFAGTLALLFALRRRCRTAG